MKLLFKIISVIGILSFLGGLTNGVFFFFGLILAGIFGFLGWRQEKGAKKKFPSPISPVKKEKVIKNDSNKDLSKLLEIKSDKKLSKAELEKQKNLTLTLTFTKMITDKKNF